MIRLSREIRFGLVPQEQVVGTKAGNSWSGWPTSNVLAPQLRMALIVEGTPDPRTGFLCNITIIDNLLRSIVLETLIPSYEPTVNAEQVIRLTGQQIVRQWKGAFPENCEGRQAPSVVELTLEVSPCLKYKLPFDQFINHRGNPMINDLDACELVLTEQFEFSAAHRLHCPELSDEENRSIFGKCNNVNGHGHNYVFEVSIAKEMNSKDDQVLPLHVFEAIVKSEVIERLDHKHLNEEVAHFSNLNPTVENIAKTIFEWLQGKFGEARLVGVKVYETPKTWAEFRLN